MLYFFHAATVLRPSTVQIVALYFRKMIIGIPLQGVCFLAHYYWVPQLPFSLKL